jgi:hypothetical protein
MDCNLHAAKRRQGIQTEFWKITTPKAENDMANHISADIGKTGCWNQERMSLPQDHWCL